MVSPYLPHALYATALTSIAIHLVGQRTESEEQRSRYESRISMLQQLRDHLRSPNPSQDEIERLKRLSRPLDYDAQKSPEVTLGWRDVWFGRKLPSDGGEMSEWDKKDLEQLKKAMEGKS
ncbi:hypothetical protein FA15DRAFT_667583 [Coprinopsis marcescibilis]|uniref:Uncharacterized protein n=1 Tax=Coprinopsis marcescibilis TaxID=230819 RepID=A0A5C3L0T6_COPMA|nr:hypothetical protein FA15DRAFT_667583 [Coprinopsis marcescibilis]